MFENLATAKVLICVGSGGVGKTTVAAALGVLMAQTGKKVLVLTIDPSQRLKTTLGISDSGDIVEVKVDGVAPKKLFAAVINAKVTFDEFVKRAVKSAGLSVELSEKIFRNKLYIQLSTTLSGSQEFTALEKLYSCYESNEFDLIILDTPPTKHAIDFLHSPQRLAALFNDKVAQWFRTPPAGSRRAGSWITGMLHTGTMQVLKALEMLTGSDFMHELRDFFQNISSWQGRLEDRVTAVHRLLVGADTYFSLVTSFDEAKLKEAEFFTKEIRKGGYRLSSVFINRAFPAWLNPPGASLQDPSALAAFYRQMFDYTQKRENFYLDFSNRMQTYCGVYKLPELDDDISDLEGVLKLKAAIAKGFENQ